MGYRHLSDEERLMIVALKKTGKSLREIGRYIGRSASTVSRELRRNRYTTDGRYRAFHAGPMSRGRRRRVRQKSWFSQEHWSWVEDLIREDFSPEQISGSLREWGVFGISHETIYRHVWRDKKNGGNLYKHFRGAKKKRRKRYNAYDSRGRLAGKKRIEERPKIVETRGRIGDWEVDTVMGKGKDCVLTMVERKSGFLAMAHLKSKTVKEVNRRMKQLIKRTPNKFKTITSDNGVEFHGYKEIEKKRGVDFYFANPHHSWERGTNENTNGLIRQYLPKGKSMEGLTQKQCDAIARKLNNRPRKRHNYRTPAELFFQLPTVALQS